MNLLCPKGKIVQKVDSVVEQAIQAAVDRDDLVRWATKPAEPLPAYHPQPKLKLTRATAYVLGRQMFKKSLSILTP